MDSERSTEKKEKRGSFFSLRKSFSGRSATAQDYDVSDTGSVVSGQDFASPISDKSARRASAPSALMAVDENTSDLGSEIGGSGLPKKSKMFSTNFVKKMFRSNSLKGSDAGGDIGSPDGISVADEDEALDESRLSDASGATGTVDESGSPKKKKRFSMKAVKKIFRSNSMSSAGGGDTPSVQESASVAGDSEVNHTPTQSRRKSMFSFGKKSVLQSTESKGIASLSISSKEPSDPYQGPISPTFMGRKPFAEDEPAFSSEETTMQMSSEDTPVKDPSPVHKQLGRSPEQTAASSVSPLTPPATLSSSGTGSAWKLFQAVEEEQKELTEGDANMSPGRLEYDLPLQNAGEGPEGEDDDKEELDRHEQQGSVVDEPFALLGSSRGSQSLPGSSKREIGQANNPREEVEEQVPVFELTIPDSDAPATPPSSPPQSHGSKHLSASTLSVDDTTYTPTVTSPQPLYDASEVESVSSYGKQKKSSMFSTKTITKLWRRASLGSPKSPLPPAPEDSSSVSTQSVASSPRSPLPLGSSKSPKQTSFTGKVVQALTPTTTRERSSSAQRGRADQFVENSSNTVQSIESDLSQEQSEQQDNIASPTVLTPAVGQRNPSPVPKRGSLSPLKGLSSMLRNSVSPKRSSKSPVKDTHLAVSEEAIAALQEMPQLDPLPSEQHADGQSHEYFDASPAALELPVKPSPVKRSTSPKPFARARSPEKFIFDITHAVETASKMLGPGELPVSTEPPKSAFVLEGSKIAHGASNDPAVLKICVHSKSESDVAVLMVPNNAHVPVTVLILRNTGIISPERFCFNLRFPYLTDLDLGWNGIAGAVKGLPPTLLRLDLSHNRITNISSILGCVDLVELNLSHNNIKSFHGLPANLERLDLSHNAITAAITLRTLALSPLIKSLDLTGNAVILEVVEWKFMLRNILTHLDELNGRPMLKPKKAGVVPSLGGRKPSPSKTRPSATVREEQRVNDAVRTRMHKMKLDMLKETQEQADKNATVKSRTLKPDEVNHLARRLSAPTKALSLKAKADPVPPPLFSSRDLAHRKSAQPIPSVVAQHTRTDVSLTDFVTRSKSQLSKAAQLLMRVTQLSNQDVIDRDDIVKLSNALSRLELYSNRDVPLKVEYAIEKLVDGDALKRRVNTVREQMDVVGLLLQQVDSAMLLSAQGAFTLRDALDSAMSSGPGIMTHTSILRSYEASFDPSSFLGARTTNPRASWQPTEVLPHTAIREDNYYYGGTVREAQDEFNYRVKDADSRHTTPARAQQSSVHSTPVAVVGYDENKSEASGLVEPAALPAAVSSEAFMDRVRSRISMRAFYGSSEAAEEAKAVSPVLKTSYVSLVHSAEDDVPPPPPPLDSPKIAETKPADVKGAAKDRVLARLGSRSSSLSRIDTETPPPPPPPLLSEPELIVQNEESVHNVDIPAFVSFGPDSPLVDVASTDLVPETEPSAEDSAQQAAAVVEADVDLYEDTVPEEEGGVHESYEGTNDYLDEEITPPLAASGDEEHGLEPFADTSIASDGQEGHVDTADNSHRTDVYGRSPRSAAYYNSTPASYDEQTLGIFSQTEEDEQWRAAQLYAEAEARASPVIPSTGASAPTAFSEYTSHRAFDGIAATAADDEEVAVPECEQLQESEITEVPVSESESVVTESAFVPVQPKSSQFEAVPTSVSHDFLVANASEEQTVSVAPLASLVAPPVLEADVDVEVLSFSSAATPLVVDSPRPDSATSPTPSDTTVDSSKMSAKDRILARMAKNKKT